VSIVRIRKISGGDNNVLAVALKLNSSINGLVLHQVKSLSSVSVGSGCMELWQKELAYVENFLNEDLEILGTFVDSVLIEFDIPLASDDNIQASIEFGLPIHCGLQPRCGVFVSNRI